PCVKQSGSVENDIDSLKLIKPKGISNVQNQSDTLRQNNREIIKIDSLKSLIKSHKSQIKSLKSHVGLLNDHNNSLKISKSLLEERFLSQKKQSDSLLKPYYTIQFDSTLNKDFYNSKFRVSTNKLTQDTIYIPLPKENRHIAPVKHLQVDTLKVIHKIANVNVVAVNYVDDPIWWEQRNSIGLDINEAAFLNWNAGGVNSIAGLLKVDLVRSYKKLHVLWNNEFYVRYGLNQQEEKGLRKTEDKIELNTTFGYRRDTISNWFYSVKANFRTQFTDGYKYPKKSSPISRVFAPAYLFLGAGTHYENKKQNFSLYLSLVTLKSTFVLDEKLSKEGAFGVVKGEKSRHQFGFLLQSVFRKEVLKNILMTNKLSLYTDYIKDFGNVDVNWELNFGLKINKYIMATVGAHLLYDDDIKFKDDIDNDGTLETLGARVQLKQFLGIGVMYRF
ncbi:MAG TPA: hypothetical protein DEO36_09355, partial [Flavobacteriaceae bacterium]|nr:hypothetical protein [Flavobacteriaceae bacterium]